MATDIYIYIVICFSTFLSVALRASGSHSSAQARHPRRSSWDEGNAKEADNIEEDRDEIDGKEVLLHEPDDIEEDREDIEVKDEELHVP
jgi:hypothetical protein